MYVFLVFFPRIDGLLDVFTYDLRSHLFNVGKFGYVMPGNSYSYMLPLLSNFNSSTHSILADVPLC